MWASAVASRSGLLRDVVLLAFLAPCARANLVVITGPASVRGLHLSAAPFAFSTPTFDLTAPVRVVSREDWSDDCPPVYTGQTGGLAGYIVVVPDVGSRFDYCSLEMLARGAGNEGAVAWLPALHSGTIADIWAPVPGFATNYWQLGDERALPAGIVAADVRQRAVGALVAELEGGAHVVARLQPSETPWEGYRTHPGLWAWKAVMAVHSISTMELAVCRIYSYVRSDGGVRWGTINFLFVAEIVGNAVRVVYVLVDPFFTQGLLPRQASVSLLALSSALATLSASLFFVYYCGAAASAGLVKFRFALPDYSVPFLVLVTLVLATDIVLALVPFGRGGEAVEVGRSVVVGIAVPLLVFALSVAAERSTSHQMDKSFRSLSARRLHRRMRLSLRYLVLEFVAGFGLVWAQAGPYRQIVIGTVFFLATNAASYVQVDALRPFTERPPRGPLRILHDALYAIVALCSERPPATPGKAATASAVDDQATGGAAKLWYHLRAHDGKDKPVNELIKASVAGAMKGSGWHHGGTARHMAHTAAEDDVESVGEEGSDEAGVNDDDATREQRDGTSTSFRAAENTAAVKRERSSTTGFFSRSLARLRLLTGEPAPARHSTPVDLEGSGVQRSKRGSNAPLRRSVSASHAGRNPRFTVSAAGGDEEEERKGGRRLSVGREPLKSPVRTRALLPSSAPPPQHLVYGMTVEAMRSWTTEMKVNRAATTQEVNRTVRKMKPDKSICEVLMEGSGGDARGVDWSGRGPGRQPVGKAHAFVVHAHSRRFLDLLAMLEGYCEMNVLDPERTYFWVDCFSLRQDAAFDQVKHLSQVIRTVGHAVLALDSIEQPASLSRAWCLWELAICRQEDAKIALAIASDTTLDLQRRFIHKADYHRKLRDTLIGLVDIRTAEASVEADRLFIHSAVAKAWRSSAKGSEELAFKSFNTSVVAAFGVAYDFLCGQLDAQGLGETGAQIRGATSTGIIAPSSGMHGGSSAAANVRDSGGSTTSTRVLPTSSLTAVDPMSGGIVFGTSAAGSATRSEQGGSVVEEAQALLTELDSQAVPPRKSSLLTDSRPFPSGL